MSTTTKIEWTEKTWNPTTGCDKVSPGCDNCYALTLAKRLKGMGSAKYQNDGDPRTSGPGFRATEHESELDAPLRWRKPAKVFVNSMSDLFHEAISAEFIAKVFAVMAQAPQHTFQVLTKRHGRMRSLLNSEHFRSDAHSRAIDLVQNLTVEHEFRWPLPNVWLGVSVEDQKWADIRIPHLVEVPAAVRFLSCEPLLGPVDLTRVELVKPKPPYGPGAWLDSLRGHVIGPDEMIDERIDWVMVGGESGPGARPMHPDWALSLRDQCTAAGVPFHFKQWGNWNPAEAGGWYSNTRWVPADGSLVPFPPKRTAETDAFMAASRVKSFRELDGRTWDEFPAVAR